MKKKPDLKGFAVEIRNLYRTNPISAETAIESYLKAELAEFSGPEKLMYLSQLRDFFPEKRHEFLEKDLQEVDNGAQEKVLDKIFALFLGNWVFSEDLSRSDLLQRLAASLNAIFDLLNELIGVINLTLYGKQFGEETIRQVIGQNVVSEEGAKPLNAYLGQIKEAFLLSRRASEETARKLVAGILREIDPEKIAGISEGGFKFGPLRKAEYFDIFREKYTKVVKWSESERFSADFCREFERNCEKSSKHEGGF